MLFGHLHGPRTRSRSTIEDSPRARYWGEYEPVVEHHVEDLVHILETIDLVLLPGRTVVRSTIDDMAELSAYIVDWSKVYPILQGITLEFSVAVHDDFSVCVVDGDCLGIAMFRLSDFPCMSVESVSKLRITHPSFMAAVMGLPYSCDVANLDGETKHTHAENPKKKSCRGWLQGLEWGDQEVGFRHHEDLTTWPYAGLRAWAEILQDPLAPRDGLQGRRRAMGLSLCGTPTFEMSNARLVGPDPVPNHSDWSARAVCAPRWFCRSEGVAGALSLSLWEKGCPETLVLDQTVPAKRVGRRWLTTRGISGSGGTTPP